MAIVGKYGQRRFLTLRKLWYNHMVRIYPNQVVAKFELKRVHYALFFLSGVIGLQNLMAGGLIMKTRKETFLKNKALIEEKYGQKHRDAFGPDSKINDLGYPDCGNNLYADCLPYLDWIKINNVMRMHESMVEKTTTVYVGTFIAALSFPKTAAFLMLWYSCAQPYYMAHYYKKGIHRSVGAEEGLKIIAFFITIFAGLSGLRMLGLFRYLNRFSPIPKVQAWRMRRAAAKAIAK
mmetsp:Transcript_27317/g.24199  ORF Transcript_27317/g.24199 Transcript_27317/m.24199 type:complete len:235 (+) Transcript_27317:7-711(+)